MMKKLLSILASGYSNCDTAAAPVSTAMGPTVGAFNARSARAQHLAIVLSLRFVA